MSNSLDPDQARHYVRPDLGASCLQFFLRLSADDTSRKRVKHFAVETSDYFVCLFDFTSNQQSFSYGLNQY